MTITAHAEKATQNAWPYVDLDDPRIQIDADVLALMEARVARTYNVIPVANSGRTVTVAVENPDDLQLAQSLRPLFAGMTMTLVYADPQAIRRTVDRVYSARGEAAFLANQGEDLDVREASPTALGGGDMGRVESGIDGSNVTILRLVIEQARRDGASDIHFEPTRDGLKVRLRIDGKLSVAGHYRPGVADGLITLIKIRAEMRTDNPLIPDSGVLSYDHDGETIDIRVETAPTVWGTTAVLRLQSDTWRDLSTLGFSPENERRFRRAISQPYGIVLITGPTNSGKTTTLYSSLRERVSDEIKILTLEDPVEYKAPDGLTQMPINDEQGMTYFAVGRSALRQDPNIVLVGEIKDPETARTAVDAAMTGHLLLSTLHTNDAPGAVPRMNRLGIESFMLGEALRCVVAQRLVRRLCGSCKVAVSPDVDAVRALGFPVENLPEVLYEAAQDGCNACRHTGYSGRIPIHEVMLVGTELRYLISEGASQREIAAAAAAGGMTTMREDGFAKAVQGVTSLAEINAETLSDLA